MQEVGKAIWINGGGCSRDEFQSFQDKDPIGTDLLYFLSHLSSNGVFFLRRLQGTRD